MKISKKGKLLIANVGFFLFLSIAAFLALPLAGLTIADTLLPTVLEQICFTFLSLFVFYFSILADAAKKKIPPKQELGKKNLSKKNKLFIANSFMVCFLLFCGIFAWVEFGILLHGTFFYGVLIQTWFTLTSLIIYYLSIIVEGFCQSEKNHIH